MKKILIVLLSIAFFSLIVYGQLNVTIEMLNGDTIPCVLITDRISMVTEYGELMFHTDNIVSVIFSQPGKGRTTLNTIFGERFSGYIMNETFKLDLFGSEIEVRKSKVKSILFENSIDESNLYYSILLNSGDLFFLNIISDSIKVQTSYGEIALPIERIKKIHFEGFGNVLTKIELKSGGFMQGIIKDEYIPIILSNSYELEIVPDLISKIEYRYN